MVSRRVKRYTVIGKAQKEYESNTRAGQFGLRWSDNIGTMLQSNQCHCMCLDNRSDPFCTDCRGTGMLRGVVELPSKRTIFKMRKRKRN